MVAGGSLAFLYQQPRGDLKKGKSTFTGMPRKFDDKTREG
jgi:hypothetical protein